MEIRISVMSTGARNDVLTDVSKDLVEVVSSFEDNNNIISMKFFYKVCFYISRSIGLYHGWLRKVGYKAFMVWCAYASRN